MSKRRGKDYNGLIPSTQALVVLPVDSDGSVVRSKCTVDLEVETLLCPRIRAEAQLASRFNLVNDIKGWNKQDMLQAVKGPPE